VHQLSCAIAFVGFQVAMKDYMGGLLSDLDIGYILPVLGSFVLLFGLVHIGPSAVMNEGSFRVVRVTSPCDRPEPTHTVHGYASGDTAK
jgi:hypothetical protein